MSMEAVVNWLLEFSFYYPLLMTYVWMIGAVYYFFYRERVERRPFYDPPELSEPVGVTFIVPCHNEGENVRETIVALLKQDYPEFEVIAINDASTDRTGEILEEMADLTDRLRVIHFETNQGKALGLRAGALAANNEILICIDGDAILERHAARWLAWHFIQGPRVGAVTGNPRVRNGTTLLGKIQVGEFSSIIGLIKRAQRIYGRIFTVSGVVAAFRRSALHRVGYWSLDMVTEDIDISWKLQMDYWDIRYEPHALCWILMPETLRGLWKQRLRWAQGGNEVLLRYAGNLRYWPRRRMWPVYIEYLTSIIWGYSMLTVILLYMAGQMVMLPPGFRVESIIPTWPGVVLGLACLLQFAISFALDTRYEKCLFKYYFVMIWYPLAFWLINMCTTVVALPKAIAKKRGERARWKTDDRGIHPVH